jgi:uncharacterized protein (TIGR02172 family)
MVAPPRRRRMNAMIPGLLVGRGLTSEVFEWDAGRVLKLSLPWRARDRTELEFRVSRAVHHAGYPCTAAHELVEYDGRLGIVFDRVEGVSMFAAVAKKPWLLRSASRELAELHVQLHSLKAPSEIPSQREQFERWIAAAKDLSPDQLEAARDALKHVQPGEMLCHGDFHPQNILYSSKGPIVIDWGTGTRGNPIGDVARTSWLFLGAPIPPHTQFHMRWMIVFFRKVVNKTYLQRYFELRPGSPKELELYAPLELAGLSAWRSQRVN